MRGKTSAFAGKPNKADTGVRRSSTSAVLSLLGAFVATAAALGLLVAGLFIPITGMTGSTVSKGVDLFNTMPGTMTANALSQQSKILAKDGTVIATPYDENRIVVTSAQIPKIMKQAQVAIEDQRFYDHGALDQRGIARAIAANLFSSSTQGASTLTQQYVKVADQNALLQSGDQQAALDAVAQHGTVAYVRKIKQLKEAVELEKTHTKDQILTSYLNLVFYGQQTYGVEAAAQHYFGHSAMQLTLPEAATLAGVVNLPDTTNPVANPAAAKKRRDIVLQKMIAQGMVTKAQGEAAINTPLTTHVQTLNAGGCASSRYPYFCDYVTAWISQQPALGKTEKERLGLLKTGGLVIQTSLDVKKMNALESNLQKRVPRDNSADVQAAAAVIEPGTGLVEAMAQNSQYKLVKTTNFTTSTNWARSGFPIGSTAKIFAIVEAMRQGRAVNSTVNVPRMTGTDETGPYAPFTSKNLSGPCGQTRGVWNVHNDHQVPAGPMSLKKATAESVNTAFAQLTGDLGACNVHADFKRLGVETRDINTGQVKEVAKNPSAIILGSDSSTPLAMANAYATVAADGKYCAPRPVVSIKQANGKPIDLNLAPCTQAMTAQQARGAAEIFKSVFESDGTAAGDALSDGREAFGKTGTVSDSKHTWFVGATKQLATAVWIGRAWDHQPAIKNVTIGGKSISGFLYGGDIAAPLWKDAMNAMSQGLPKEKFASPDDSTKQGDQVSVPDVKGKSESDATNELKKAGFLVTVKKENSGDVDGGQAFKTDPAAGQKLGKGKKITLYVKP